MLEMILKGGWQTPNHPKGKKQKDDMHEIKAEILSSLPKRDYENKVGCNPDISINGKSQKIILVGTGDFNGKSYTSDLQAEDFFVKIQFVSNTLKLSRFMFKRNTFFVPYIPELIADLIIYQMQYGSENGINIIIRREA